MGVTPFVNDGVPNRDFVDYDEPNGVYTLSVHHVTKATEGEVMTPGGQIVNVRDGQYLVDRGGNKYDVHDDKEFAEWNLVPAWDQKDLPQYEAPIEEEQLFDPNEVSADTVRRYLRDPAISDEEKERVIEAEREGKNRRSAFPV